MSERLEVDFLGIPFKNPILTASGTFGFGFDYERYYPPSELGGFCTKGLTLEKRPGNFGQRLWETPSGLLNSIGLENPGVDYFIDTIYPRYKEIGTNVIVNASGSDIESYLRLMERLNEIDFAFIELNISCPNVSAGGMAFGTEPKAAYDLVNACVKESRHKIVVKLTPNVTDIASIALACEDAGADGLSLINTLQGMAIDVDKKRIVFDRVYAGLSGPAVKPVALRMVHQVAQRVSIPIIGIGGITDYKDALEFIMAGARLVEVGTFIFAYPKAPLEIISALEEYLVENDTKIEDLIGIL